MSGSSLHRRACGRAIGSILFAVALTVVGAGCRGGDDGGGAAGPVVPIEAPGAAPDSAPLPSGEDATAASSSNRSDEEELEDWEDVEASVEEIVGDVDDFWAREFAQLDAPYDYETVDPDRRVALTPRSADAPVCNGEQPTYDDGLVENAYVADCNEGLIMVWDDDQLIPGLYERFGSVGVAMLFAHEWGHVIQFQLEVDAPTIVTEQQADCYSGAWLADAQERDLFYAKAADLDAAIGATLEVSDAVGASADPDEAHGLGFDRIRAVQEGFNRGITFCNGYIESPPTVTETSFLREEIATGGNIAFDELVPAEQDGLNRFFGYRIDGFTSLTAVEADSEDLGRSGCEPPSGLASACPNEGIIEYDGDRIAELHERIGDGSTAVLLALAWARATDEGAIDRDPVGRFLFNACRSGAYLADDEGELTLSPGDLDEAVRAFVQLADETSNRALAPEGAVFEAVGALRLGVTQGYTACG